MNYLDTDALMRSIGIGLLIGLIVAGLFSALSTKKGKSPFASTTIIVTLLAAFILYFIWPSVSIVPDLDGLTSDEAIALLESNDLTAQVDSQLTVQAKAGNVIEGSQIPPAGEKLPPKSSVKFSVGTFAESYVRFVSPISASETTCEVLPSNIGRVYVSANIKASPNQAALLWIKGVSPATPVWYLQKYPFGLSSSAEKDFWFGHAQIGNPEYPPQDDSVFDFAITIMDKTESEQLMGQPGEFSVDTPQGHSLTIAEDVIMKTEVK